MKIVIISGSPRKVSITVRVALHLQKLLQADHEVEFIDLRTEAMPPIQSVFSTEEKTPDEYKPLRKKMMEAESFIFVSPEYNGGYSANMKNLLDHFPKSAYMRKVIGIVTASDGAFGGMRAAMQLQFLVCALFGIPCPQMLVTPLVDKKFDEEGGLTDPLFEPKISGFLKEYLWLAESVRRGKQ